MIGPRYAYFVPPVIIEPARAQIILPAFTLAVPVWAGASGILAQYPFNNTDAFSLKLPINAFGENFIAAIRWMDDDDIFVRYVLFEHDDAELFYPLYNGERAEANAVLEIWSVDSEEAPSLADDYTFYSSALVFPFGEVEQCGQCCQNNSLTTTLVAVPPSTLPPGSACNPFCGDLCNTEPPMPVCECPIVLRDTVADLRAVDLTGMVPPIMARTFGGAVAADGYGKDWRWNSISVAVDDGTAYTVVARPDNINAAAPGRWEQTPIS